MSLRARLVALLVGLVALGLVVADLVTWQSLKSFEYSHLDQQVAAAEMPIAHQYRAALVSPTVIADSPALASLPLGTLANAWLPGQGLDQWVVLLANQDTRISTSLFPRLRRRALHVAAARGAPQFRDVRSPGGERYRLALLPIRVREAPALLAPPNGRGATGLLVVAVPVSGVAATLERLALIEILVSAAVLGVAGLTAFWLVRVGLRPLDDMAETASAIAEGELSRRVPVAAEDTEVGRLGLALNVMLTRIEAAFLDQRRSEERLRRFVSDAGHELRTPLTSIRGYAELFRRGASDRPEDLARAMRRIEQEATRMGGLVEDLLLLARLDEGRPLETEPVDLCRIVADAVGDAEVVEPDRPFEVSIPDRPVMTIGDEARLRQVVANLLANVRAHTPPGTPAAVRLTATGDGRAVLAVADQGPGMDQATCARVFERFYRADPSRSRTSGGSGLGLSIVAAIVAAHRGRVGVTSTLGVGTCFTVELPLAPAPAALPAGDAAVASRPPAPPTPADEPSRSPSDVPGATATAARS